MNRIYLLLACIFCVINISAQITIKDFVEKIDWESTESKFVYDFYPFIEPSKHTIWENENTESNFKLKNIYIADVEVLNSYIRVNIRDKKLYRINLIMIDRGNDRNKPIELINALIKDFGEPNKREEERLLSNLVTTELTWKTLDYKLSLYYMKGEYNDLVVSIEPYEL